ncbi:MAG TPA: NAD(P)H-binding protein [Bryobacteraceae bacterium]|nr:NAD(P)H-binding protein [Bryobacteraceae bacterium]
METILVTGATGNVGREIVAHLNGTGVRVRAMTRQPESAGLPREVEVVQGDLTVPRTLAGCLEGVDAVFLVWTAPADAVGPALEQIARHARRIVFLSNMTVRDSADEQNYPVTALHLKIERLIAAAGVQWTFLRPGAFATNARIWWAAQIRAGDVVRWPYADAALSPIHERDIAAVAIRALLEDTHAGAKYILTGPQALTQREQVRMIGDAIGRKLRFEEIPPETARLEMLKIMPAQIVEMLLEAFAAATASPAPVTSTVAQVTGAPAHSFRQWALDHAPEFR